MKIIKKNDSTPKSNAKTVDKTNLKQKSVPIIVGAGLIVVFLTVFGLLTAYASPDKYTATGALTQDFVILDSSGGTYTGPVNDLVYDGVGGFQYLSGGSYTGEFSKSKRSGEGTFNWANGDSYTGTWENDKMTQGTYTFADGKIFNGTFNENTFVAGEYSMTGNALKNTGFTSFKCQYNKGTISSYVFTYKGLTYSGSWTGTADITYANGDKFSGSVTNGVPNGDGTYVWTSASTSYSGGWKDGTMNGEGRYNFTANSYPYIQGTFQNGRPTGTAVYYKAEGNTFDTTWSNGQCTKVTET